MPVPVVALANDRWARPARWSTSSSANRLIADCRFPARRRFDASGAIPLNFSTDKKIQMTVSHERATTSEYPGPVWSTCAGSDTRWPGQRSFLARRHFDYRWPRGSPTVSCTRSIRKRSSRRGSIRGCRQLALKAPGMGQIMARFRVIDTLQLKST